MNEEDIAMTEVEKGLLRSLSNSSLLVQLRQRLFHIQLAQQDISAIAKQIERISLRVAFILNTLEERNKEKNDD